MADAPQPPIQQTNPQQTTPQAHQHKPQVAPKPLDPEKIHLTVRNRSRIIFDDNVKSVSSKNDTGIFDILPEHANFISLITPPLTIRKLDGTKQEIPFSNGIIKVKNTVVHCYIDLIVKDVKK